MGWMKDSHKLYMDVKFDVLKVNLKHFNVIGGIIWRLTLNKRKNYRLLLLFIWRFDVFK